MKKLVSAIILLITLSTTFLVNAENELEYSVKQDDVLHSIASKYGVTMESIIERNGLENRDLLLPGQKLVIPLNTAPATSQQAISPPLTTTTTISIEEDLPKPAPSVRVVPRETFPASYYNTELGASSISVNVSNVDSKTLFHALAVSMGKDFIMLQKAAQTGLTFRTENVPLLSLFDLLLKNENAKFNFLSNTLVIEPIETAVQELGQNH